MNLAALSPRLAPILCGLILWQSGLGTNAERMSPRASQAEKLETKDAVIYKSEPHDPLGAREQQQEEERKEAESWEMLRRLTIEIERPKPQSEPSFPSHPRSRRDH